MLAASGARLCGVVLVTSCLGCLDAPPDGTVDDGDGTADDAAPPLGDAGSCRGIARPPFDDAGTWLSVQPDTSTIVVTADMVELTLSEDAGADAYADLHSLVAAGIDGTSLTARLTVSMATDAWAGISWHATEDVLDYYDLAVRDGVLYARQKAEDGEAIDTCTGSCPLYDQEDPPMLRLQAMNGLVHYQTSADGSTWQDVGTAPLRGLDYQALLFLTALPFGSASMTVNAAEWLDCAR